MTKTFLTEQELIKILKKIDKNPEWKLRKLMGRQYIDTPGNYTGERKDYYNIIEYYKMNMGKFELQRLINWIKLNYDKVKKLR